MVSEGNGTGFVGDKEVDEEALRKTVRTLPDANIAQPPGFDTGLIWFVGTAADEFTPFATPGGLKKRDRELRMFAPTENSFLGAMGIVAARNAGFNWILDGPDALVTRFKEVLEYADDGRGWASLINKTEIDLDTQDNGAFWEWVREEDKPESPVIAVNHLDSYRCWHTGDPRKPVVYQDMKGKYHLLNWWNVHEFAYMPAPIEGLPGLQYCALTRLLRACQIIKNIAIYTDEKTGGRHTRAIHMIKGLTQTQIEDAMKKHEMRADTRGQLRYTNPLIVGSVDPKADVGHDTLELASLPDGWNQKENYDLYIAQLAMAFMSDYQEFAPLPGGNLGTSAQSQVLHQKMRGKGPAIFMNAITYAINLNMLPDGVEFLFDEQDYEADKTLADVRKVRADTRTVMITSGEITTEAARQMAVDDGDIPQEIFDEYLKDLPTDEEKRAEEQAQQQAQFEQQQQAFEQSGADAFSNDSTMESGAQPSGPPTSGDTTERGRKHVTQGHGRYDQWRHAPGGRKGGFPQGDPRNDDPEMAKRHAFIEKEQGRVLKSHGDTESRNTVVDPATGERMYTPERSRLHREIVAEVMGEAAMVPNDGKAIIMGGLPGSGKGHVQGGARFQELYGDPKNYLTIDPDNIKARLLKRGAGRDYADTGLKGGDLSPLLHEEASHIAKLVASAAYPQRKNVIWDITMGSDDAPPGKSGSITKRINALRENGYSSVSGVLVDTSAARSVRQAASRWKNGGPYDGRYVSLDRIWSLEGTSRKTFTELSRKGMWDSEHVFLPDD